MSGSDSTSERQKFNGFYKPLGRKFRWICKVDGIEPFVFSTLKSLVGNMLEAKIHWLEDMETVSVPAKWKGDMTVDLLNGQGNAIRRILVKYDGYEVLSCDLDYSSSVTLDYRVVFKNVVYLPVPPVAD